MIAGAGMGQGVLGRYAPIRQAQQSTTGIQGGMEADTGQVRPSAMAALRGRFQPPPLSPDKPAPNVVPPGMGQNPAVQQLMNTFRNRLKTG